MRKQVLVIAEVLLIIITIIYYYVEVFIPEYSKRLGSSDSFIRTSSYMNMVELIIDDVDFALIWNKDKKVYHIFFYSENSICLYNREIEGNSFDEAISLSLKWLSKNNYLRQDSSVRIVKYGNKDYKEFSNILVSRFRQYGISNFLEEEKTLEIKSQELDLGVEKRESILLSMDMYSKEKRES